VSSNCAVRSSARSPAAALNRRGILALGILALATSFVFPAEAQSALGQQPKDSQAIIARGIIRVAVTQFDLPGFHSRSSTGELFGPEIDLTRNIARLMNVGVQFVEDCPTFDAVIDAVASDRADIGVSKLSQTPARILHVRFSDPYFTVRHALLFDRVFVGTEAAGRPPEEVLRKFNGTLGVIGGSAFVDFARRNFPEAQISEMQRWEDTIEALANGRLDAVYRDEFEIRRALRANPTLNVRFGSAVLTDQKSFISFAVCPTCVRLQQFINYEISENRVPFTIASLLASRARN
jgi:polar amino acid transport system substrate-binding protein